jgi:hypothetical protein
MMAQRANKAGLACPGQDSAVAGPSRRKLLISLFWTALFADAAILLGKKTARAQQKVSKELAKYQDSPNDGHKCSDCVFFEPPGSCKAVDGDISPNGWCQLFTPKAA